MLSQTTKTGRIFGLTIGDWTVLVCGLLFAVLLLVLTLPS